MWYTMTEEKTTIKVTKETWKMLNDRKTEPGQTYDDVIRELLDEGNARTMATPAD